MGVFDKLRKRPTPPAAAADMVRCSACGEMNSPSALVCSICRGALPPHSGQQVRSTARPK